MNMQQMNSQQLKREIKTLKASRTNGLPITRAAVQKQGKRSARGVKGRSNNGSLTLQITTTKAVVEALDKILETGLYGNSRGQAAERLLTEGIRGILQEGTILKMAKVFC